MYSRGRKIYKQSGYSYLLYLPAGYESGDNRPMILFLHGVNDRGNDLEQVRKAALPTRIESGPELPFVVVSPQCPRQFYWSPKLVADLIDEVLELYMVDPNRIYLTGISMGGYGAWETAFHQPWRFAAIAPICGGGNSHLVNSIRELPIWVFHGARDEIVPLSESELMVKALKDIGADVRFTIYPDAGHDSWTQTYQNPDLYEWFLSHSRKDCNESSVFCKKRRGIRTRNSR
jgi:predicted peptidase